MIRTIKLERVVAFHRLLPTDVYLWLKALLLAGVAIQAARVFWVLVTPVGPLGDWQPAKPATLPVAAQSALLASLDPFQRTTALTTAATPAAIPADLQLFGTLAGPRGSAIIAQGGGEQKSYVIGEEVAPGVRLVGVLFDRVVLDAGGTRSELVMPQDGGAAPEAPTGAAPSSTPTGVAQLISLEPRRSGDQVTGVIVGPGRSPALFQAAGFQNGDVVLSVNGAKISSAIDIQQLQSALIPGARLTLMVERGDKTLPLALNIPAAP